MHINQTSFQKNVLAWYEKHGRKDLPWQKKVTPYRVWLSEVMLQQTQVKTVIPYFNTFIMRFPNIQSLAKASLDEVLHLWTGLGYYSRARNLHHCANTIVDSSNGIFPTHIDELIQLPGIGRSTAGAILSLGMNQRAAILDGNVKRVLARVFSIEGWPGDNKVQKKLWQIAEHYTPTLNIQAYNQVMMDLGAMVCTRSKPSCNICPLHTQCLAYKHNLTTVLPHKKPKKNIPIRSCFMLLMVNELNEALLLKRPPTGIWGGLWSLPEYQNIDQTQSLLQKFPVTASGKPFPLDKIKHIFSHFQLIITPIMIKVQQKKNVVMEDGQQIWYKPKQSKVGLPQPIKKLLDSEQAAPDTKRSALKNM